MNQESRLPAPVKIEVQTKPWDGKLPSVKDAACSRLNGHRWSARCRPLLTDSSIRLFLVQAKSGIKSSACCRRVWSPAPSSDGFWLACLISIRGACGLATKKVARQMIDEACSLADELDVKHLELRHELPVQHPKFNYQRTDKVHMRLTLPDSVASLSASLKSKVRSQVKKSHEFGLTAHFGDRELLDDFTRCSPLICVTWAHRFFREKISTASILASLRAKPNCALFAVAPRRRRLVCWCISTGLRKFPVPVVSLFNE